MTPGKRVSVQDTARIRSYLEDTEHPLSVGAIADLMGLSRRTIERLKLNFELFNAPYPPPSARVGRPPILTGDQQGVSCRFFFNLHACIGLSTDSSSIQFVRDFFTQNPHAHLADATAAVWERFDVNLSARSVSNVLLKHKWNRQGKRKSNFQGPEAESKSTDTGEGQDEPSELATKDVVRQLSVLPSSLRRPIATQVPPGPSHPRRQGQPVATQLRDSSSASPPVMLPEIELPTFALQSGGSPTPDYMSGAMSAPQVRLPCPTCGCSSREHQDF
jgi:transposase